MQRFQENNSETNVRNLIAFIRFTYVTFIMNRFTTVIPIFFFIIKTAAFLLKTFKSYFLSDIFSISNN